jgi:hypothetical protein
MNIGPGAPAGNHEKGSADAAPQPRTGKERCLPTEYEEALWHVRSCDADFAVSGRAKLLNDLIGSQGYLTNGWLAADSACPGPVIKLREEASSAAGVVFGEDNLGLEDDVLVLGMCHAHGGADSYYLCQWPVHAPVEEARFFVVCIESGQRTGRYEIFVDHPREWDQLLEYLRA